MHVGPWRLHADAGNAAAGRKLMFATRNLFANVPERLIDEEITILAEFPGARIERIV